jgi:membrane protease YdiL (CAAX protease family)
MTAGALAGATPRVRDRSRAGLLLVGFAAAVALRVAVGGVAPARSPAAGLAFAAVLCALVVADGGTRARLGARPLIAGCLGAAVLLLPAVVRHAVTGGVAPGGSYAVWAAVVTVVATAEEAFLRGTLHDRVERSAGPVAAVVVGAVAFAALHVPLYGMGAAPLDLAVGLWLGALRVASGSWLAPAIAHVGSDLAAWWLR